MRTSHGTRHKRSKIIMNVHDAYSFLGIFYWCKPTGIDYKTNLRKVMKFTLLGCLSNRVIKLIQNTTKIPEERLKTSPHILSAPLKTGKENNPLMIQNI